MSEETIIVSDSPDAEINAAIQKKSDGDFGSPSVG